MDVATRPPKPPRNLSAAELRLWRELAPTASRLGRLTKSDVTAFRLLLKCLLTIEACEELLDTDGLISKSAGGTMKTHPAVRILDNARRQAARQLDEFGLSPSSRIRAETERTFTETWGVK